jgi:hypothetical protein
MSKRNPPILLCQQWWIASPGSPARLGDGLAPAAAALKQAQDGQRRGTRRAHVAC